MVNSTDSVGRNWSLVLALYSLVFWPEPTLEIDILSKTKHQSPSTKFQRTKFKFKCFQSRASYSCCASRQLHPWPPLRATIPRNPLAVCSEMSAPRGDRKRSCVVHASQTAKSRSDSRCKRDDEPLWRRLVIDSAVRKPALLLDRPRRPAPWKYGATLGD